MAQKPAFEGNQYRTRDDLLAWLGQSREAPIEPDLPVVDAHHHLWNDDHRRYQIPDLVDDIGTMNVIASVFIECGATYDTRIDYSEGAVVPPEIYKQPVSEIRFVVGEVASHAGAERHGLCKAIVGFGNLLVGETAARDMLETFSEAGTGRFRGIRQSAAWDPAIGEMAWRTPPPGLYFDDRFRSGFQALQALGLSFDAWLYYPQLYDVILLARRFPAVTIVLDHFGGMVGILEYAAWPKQRFRQWRAYMHELAQCPNVVVKMGGLGMPMVGLGTHLLEKPADSAQLATAWKPYVDVSVEAFGSKRCMIGSNFPVDRQTAHYTTVWNAYKIATKNYSKDERRDLFSGTASRVYKLKK